MEIINYLRRKESGTILQHVGYHKSSDYLMTSLFNETVFRVHKYEAENEYEVIEDKSIIDKIERQTCGQPQKKEGPHYWRVLPNSDRICSFCGSMHSSDVLAAIKKNGTSCIERSTKSYKWYIRQPGIRNAREGGIKYYRDHDTPEFIEQYNELLKQTK